MPVLHARRAGMIGGTPEGEAVPPVRPDCGRNADRGARVDESSALLDMQLDECADPCEPLLIGAEVPRVKARR